MDIELLERNRVRFDVLVGEVLDAVDIDKEENQILLTTRSGRKFLVYHEQDCCEKVQIVGQDGNFDNLIGRPLIEARDFAVDTGEIESYYDINDNSWGKRFRVSNSFYPSSVRKRISPQ